MGKVFGLVPDDIQRRISEAPFFISYFRALYYFGRDAWNTVIGGMSFEGKTIDEVKAIVFAPIDTLVDTLKKTPTDRHEDAERIHVFIDSMVLPVIEFFKRSMNFVIELSSIHINWAHGRTAWQRTTNDLRSAIYNLFSVDDIARDLKYSKLRGIGQSVYARRFSVLEKELENNDAGFVSQAINVFFFTWESAIHFSKLLEEIKKECYSGRDKLEYTVIVGESQVDEKYLQFVIDNANAGRASACEYYREKMGPNATNAQEFFADQYSLVTKASKEGQEIPRDVLMLDAVGHNMLMVDEPACMLRFLCYAGMVRAKDERQGRLDPRIDLLFGIIVSGGETSFHGPSYETRLRKIGTPKMAEAFYQGYSDNCAPYDKVKDCDHWALMDL